MYDYQEPGYLNGYSIILTCESRNKKIQDECDSQYLTIQIKD